ncbi:hypothetical protein EZS27_019593, partial [termite gut metagenome]
MRKIVILLFLCLFRGWTLPSQAQSFDNLWKQVEQAERQSLPQTVLKLTDNIFRKAETEKNSPQMLKAYIRRTQYQENLTPDSFYVHLADIEHWANTASVSIDRAILHSIVAEMYADYAYQNSWQLRNNRKIVDDEQLTDIRQWSGNRFVQRVLEHTRMALKDSLLLLDTSSKTYIPFVVTNKTSDYYGHDMYHLLTLRGTNALSRLLWDKDPTVTAEAYSLFHAMIGVYGKRNNQDAVLLATLDSLSWNRNDELSEEALNKLIAGNKSRETCAEAYLIKAQQANQKRKYTEALQLCNEAIAKYPKYRRINALESLKQEILKPALSISFSRKTYSGATIDLRVNHRNLSSFTVEYHKVNLPATSPLLNKQPDKAFYKKYGRKVDSQRLSLSPANDYSFQDTVITVKAPSKGVYLMRITPSGGKAETSEGFLFVTDFQVLIRTLSGDNQCEIAVLDAESGKPVSDALVRLFTEKKGERVEVKTLSTGNNGKVQFFWTASPDTYRYLTAEKDGDRAMPFQDIYKRNYSGDEKPRSQMTLLTDRSLYRPGQTVYVKGIAYDSQVDTANVVTGKNYTLTLTDGTNREIGKKEVRTNDFGSFTTDFVLPSSGLNGEYYVKTGEGTSINIRVEEYKRPTFDVVFASQEDTYRLGDSLKIRGTVKTYSGFPLQEVSVKYTLTRQAFTWLRFRRDRTLLASGITTANEAGEFTVPVQLQADTNDGFYIYEIEVAVTNAAGETQTSTTNIAAGSRSLLLSAQIAEKICKEQSGNATFRATNLNLKPVNTEVEYKLFLQKGEKEGRREEVVHSGTFTANTEMPLSAWQHLPSGTYKLTLSAQDEQGRKADYEQEILLFSINDTRPSVKTEVWYYPVHTEFNASQSASFIFGTSGKDAYILTDVFCGNKRLESKILQLSDTLVRFDYPYKEEYGRGLDISFAFVKEGKFHQQEVHLTKKMPEKELKITREVFRNKLLPGQKEEWKFTVKTPQGLPAVAEMLAFMYDASLDKIWKNNRTFHVNYSLGYSFHSWFPYDTRYNYYSFWFPSAQLTIPG